MAAEISATVAKKTGDSGKFMSGKELSLKRGGIALDSFCCCTCHLDISDTDDVTHLRVLSVFEYRKRCGGMSEIV